MPVFHVPCVAASADARVTRALQRLCGQVDAIRSRPLAGEDFERVERALDERFVEAEREGSVIRSSSWRPEAPSTPSVTVPCRLEPPLASTAPHRRAWCGAQGRAFELPRLRGRAPEGDVDIRVMTMAAYFGARVSARIMTDNPKSAVLQRLCGEAPVFNPHYADFARHHRFEIAPCNVGAGHEKGRVEASVAYVKNYTLTGLDITDFRAVNPAARHWLDTVANVRIHGETRKRPVELFAL